MLTDDKRASIVKKITEIRSRPFTRGTEYKLRLLLKYLLPTDCYVARARNDPGGRSRSPSFGVWKRD